MRKLISILFVTTLALNLVAQTVVTPEWVKNYSDRDNMTNIPSAIDANGNIYVTGSVRTVSQNYNFATIKYNQLGDTLWVKKYNGIANNVDEAIAIALDATGNIIVVGKSKNINGNFDIVTIKYDPNGILLFANIYNGTLNGDDIPTDVTIDNSGSIYTVGYSKQTGTYDSYLTIKYLSNGTQSWLKTYNATTTGDNHATGVFWKNNRLFVSGYSFQANGTFAVTTQSYHAGNGVVLWTQNYGSAITMPITPAKIANFSNNIYVSGSVGTATNMNYSLVSYTLNNGNQQWAQTYDGYGLIDLSTSLVSDNSGNVFITGKSLNTGNEYEYHTLKYNSSGSQLWVNKYPIKILGTMVNNKIALDPYNTIYICGEVKAGNSRDMLLYQLNQSGNMQWDETYNGQANGVDGATDMVIDSQGRIFLTGQTYNGVAKFDYTTIKLSQSFVYSPPDLNNEPRQSSFGYIKNKGQLVNTNNVLIPEIKYYVPNTYPSLYFTSTRLSYVFAKTDTSENSPDTLQRIDMTFANCNQLARIFPIDTTDGYTNYFLAQCPQGITNVKGYERLFEPNIYPNIDLHYYSNNSGLKMYFVLKPGANIKDISLLFDGQSHLQVNQNNQLEINSAIGSTTFEQPHAYMVNYGQQIVPVNWQTQWQVSGNKANLIIGNWNGNFPLVIMVDKGHMQFQQSNSDDWSTFYGGAGYDIGTDIITDNVGNAYFCGNTLSSNFPNIIGGFDILINGSLDAFLAKLNPQGKPEWGTFYGGINNDYAYNIAINSLGDIYMVGTTLSGDISLSPAGNSSLNGNNDGYITRFNNGGNTLLFSKYFGGNGGGLYDNYEQVRSIAIDNLDNVYIAGITQSNNSFPIVSKAGAYNQGSTTATELLPDAFIAEFDISNNQIWGTYFGGNGKDDFSHLKIGANNSVYASGSTSSSIKASSNPSNTPCDVPNSPDYFPDCDPGSNAHSQDWSPNKISGYSYAIIVEFDQTGKLAWSTYFGGSSEQSTTSSGPALGPVFLNSIAVNPSNPNIIYMVGGVYSGDTYFPKITSGNSYTQPLIPSGVVNGYIAKFESRELTWSTSFGPTIDGANWTTTTLQKVDCDNANNIYLTGITSGSYSNVLCSPPTNPNIEFPQCNVPNVFFQNSFGGGLSGMGYGDGFISAFNSNNQLVWSTFYGGNEDEISTIGTVDIVNKRFYLTGQTNSTSNFPLFDPMTNNYQQPNKNGYQDAFIARFNISPIIYSIFENTINSYSTLNIYPNPIYNNELLNIKFSSEKISTAQVNIYNSLGAIKLKTIEEVVPNENIFSIDVSKLTQGMYLLQVVLEGKVYSNKFIIK
ncbi:MAG: SBBP repeat-containing protein [Bacteroidia bacterium]|nr:SBBP repeat-containing protein [Bacteroidia bacterium]